VEWELAKKMNYLEKTCPSATLSTTNPTWPDLGSNPGRRGGKPATNRLSYGTALVRTNYNCAVSRDSSVGIGTGYLETGIIWRETCNVNTHGVW
jgi:hypothetical protein